MHSFKDHFFVFKMKSKLWSYLPFWQRYRRLSVHTLKTANSRKTYRKYNYSPEWYEIQMPKQP